MNSKIEEAKENFKKWFVGTIDLLCKEEFAGIPLLMISFPLFERYAEAINKNIFQAFCEDFRLHNKKEAIIVWKTFRNGILHSASFNTEVDLIEYDEYKSIELINQCGVKDDISKEVQIEQDKAGQWSVFISPVKFARKVIKLVLNNFEMFYKANEKLCPLSSVQQVREMGNGFSGISDCGPLEDGNGVKGYTGFSKPDSFCGHSDSHHEDKKIQNPNDKN